MVNFFLQAVIVAGSLIGAVGAQGSYDNSSDLPIVDLGYTLQQASLFNSTGAFYNFSNIRYAAPPTGKNRFAAPKAPAVNRTVCCTSCFFGSSRTLLTINQRYK